MGPSARWHYGLQDMQSLRAFELFSRAQMAAAKSPSGYTLVRGTSFAAPIVAGLLALNLPAPDKAAADRAVMALAQEAVHLGSPGPDSVYGFGLVGEALRRQPVLTTLRAD